MVATNKQGRIKTGQGGRPIKPKAAFAKKPKVQKTQKAKQKNQETKPEGRNLTKKILQAGALLTGAMDRGSSGGIAGSIIKLDGSKSKEKPPKDGFFGEQNTDDASGQKDYYKSEKKDK